MKKLNGKIEYVYVIQSKSNIFKIGSSKNPNQRLKQLQTGNANKLKIIHLICCTKYPAKYLEKKIQYWFRFNKLIGEWRALSAEDLEFLLSIKTD